MSDPSDDTEIAALRALRAELAAQCQITQAANDAHGRALAERDAAAVTERAAFYAGWRAGAHWDPDEAYAAWIAKGRPDEPHPPRQ